MKRMLKTKQHNVFKNHVFYKEIERLFALNNGSLSFTLISHKLPFNGCRKSTHRNHVKLYESD